MRIVIGSLRYHNGDSHEKWCLKSQFEFFQSLSRLLQLIYKLSNASELLLNRIPKNHTQVQKEKENLAFTSLCRP